MRDGLRAVKNVLDDGAVVLGAGAFEVAAAQHLRGSVKKSVTGRAKLGVEAFAEALLGFVKILAENSGCGPRAAVLLLCLLVLSVLGGHARCCCMRGQC